MKFMMKTSLGLLVLCSFVFSIPVGEVNPKPTDAPILEAAKSASVAPVEKSDINTNTATRSNGPTTPLPELNHGSDTKASAPPHVNAAPENNDHQTASDKPVTEKPKETGKNSASSNSQMYPLALTSVIVILFRAI